MSTSTAFAETKKNLSKLKTEVLQKKLSAGDYNATEKQAAEEVLTGRGVDLQKAEPVKKAAAEKKEKPAPKEKEKKDDPAEKKEKPEKKKSEKIGLTKSDKMRTMLRAGNTTKEIIDAFEAEQITVRYPEIRRNRLWLIEKEEWVDPNKDKKSADEKAGDDKEDTSGQEGAGGTEDESAGTGEDHSDEDLTAGGDKDAEANTNEADDTATKEAPKKKAAPVKKAAAPKAAAKKGTAPKGAK